MPYSEKFIRGTLPGTFVPVEYHTDKNGKEIIDTLKEEIERISENVSDSLENSFSDKSIWPHWEEKELDFRCIPYEPVLLRKYFL